MPDKENMAAPADYNVSQMSKLKRKAKEAPFVPIGIAGMLAALGYAAYSYKNRGRMSTSVFLMHTRVKAQGMIVGAMALGVGYSLFNDYILKKDPEPESSKPHPEHKKGHLKHDFHFDQPHHKKHHSDHKD